jgi:hypothetical protein
MSPVGHGGSQLPLLPHVSPEWQQKLPQLTSPVAQPCIWHSPPPPHVLPNGQQEPLPQSVVPLGHPCIWHSPAPPHVVPNGQHEPLWQSTVPAAHIGMPMHSPATPHVVPDGQQ